MLNKEGEWGRGDSRLHDTGTAMTSKRTLVQNISTIEPPTLGILSYFYTFSNKKSHLLDYPDKSLVVKG